jgi:two-component system, chemotaxis family, protein-glutamate methylesterase/glutaminase
MAKKKSLTEKTDLSVRKLKYEAIVIGASAGGLDIFTRIFKKWDDNFPIPIIVVQHVHADSDGGMVEILNKISKLNIKEADEKEMTKAGHVYFAPANYHLLIEKDHTLSLSIDAKVNYSRPAIDVLFESAANVYGSTLVGVLLTGANSDGAKGMMKIKKAGGVTIVQNPESAYAASMPESAMKLFKVDHVVEPDHMASKILQIIEGV